MKHLKQLGFIGSIVLSSLILQNCGSDEPSLKEDVYLAGFLDEGKDNYSVVYFKNGVSTVIGGGDVNEYANDITFDGNDMYIAGGINDYANVVYWENGVKKLVPKNSDFEFSWEEIQKIVVVNGKKYFLTYGPSGTTAYRYYVDGVKTILPTQSSAEDMAVASNGDVYVVGKSNVYKAVYWKNGVMKELYNGDSGATGVSIVGSDVYISGWYMNDDSYPVPVVWKNEVMTEIGEPGAYTGEIAVSGNNVYVVGELTVEGTFAMWKNGVQSSITADGFGISRVYDIEVKNGNVYILAKDALNGKPLLLKNGDLQEPFDGTYEGEMYALAVK